MWKDAVERDQTHGPAGSTDTGVGARRKRGGAERALRGVAEDPLQMAGAPSGARHRGVGGEEPGAASQSTRHPRRSKRSHRDPLTLTDAHRRYRLRCQIVPNTDTVPVRAIFEAAFREYRLREVITPITERRLQVQSGSRGPGPIIDAVGEARPLSRAQPARHAAG